MRAAELPGPEGVRFHQLGCPDVLCCVGAVNRIIPNYIIHMWMATPDDGLAATLYGPSTVSALAGPKTPVKITTTTDYPFGETIRMKLDPREDVEFPLYLRIPGWCQEPRLTLNGDRGGGRTNHKGFVKIARRWRKGDVVELRFPMRPRIERGFETAYPAATARLFQVHAGLGISAAAAALCDIVFGPLLFSLPIADVDPNTPVKDAKWQYALDARGSRATSGQAAAHAGAVGTGRSMPRSP